ncbi:hypothetical protein J2Z83_003133 [Virgibacillus natechei]|uniref:DUF3221 domain-containing protein n=1 Tax=Virgibacillus natechei TaxID=1216297 RepID=A0ABS4IJA1_9BACI|nr:hypothetical protein [Virgibacillus natechei]MBP1970996.1 hypothetical protein [Virgibacillus natechei]UZD12757.1 hypothetical protein OLD84_18000 [Virgibacillus natechei]
MKTILLMLPLLFVLGGCAGNSNDVSDDENVTDYSSYSGTVIELNEESDGKRILVQEAEDEDYKKLTFNIPTEINDEVQLDDEVTIYYDVDSAIGESDPPILIGKILRLEIH